MNADGLLDLSSSDLRALPEGVSRLAYLPHPGLRKLDLHGNRRLAALPEGLCALAGLEELDLNYCGLGLWALPEGIGRLAGLKKLVLNNNGQGWRGWRRCRG